MASGSQHAGCVELLLRHGAADNADVTGTLARDSAVKESVKTVFKQYNFSR